MILIVLMNHLDPIKLHFVEHMSVNIAANESMFFFSSTFLDKFANLLSIFVFQLSQIYIYLSDIIDSFFIFNQFDYLAWKQLILFFFHDAIYANYNFLICNDKILPVWLLDFSYFRKYDSNFILLLMYILYLFKFLFSYRKILVQFLFCFQRFQI